jgi:ADP-dependent NAD(P)H-hydrate dehydratase
MGMAIEKPEPLVYLIKEFKRIGMRLLLDAWALIPAILKHISGTNSVVTPHPGEYRRLFQKEENYGNMMQKTTTL